MTLGYRLALAISIPALIAPHAVAQPTAQQAMTLKPVQSDVAYDTPSAAELDQCEIKPEKQGGMVGWVVRGPNGEQLRRFVDSNGDNKVDMWRYYQNGLETYRDIDSDFDGTADQYRWFGSAGMRWGIDKDADGTVDSWKSISPQEVSAEVVAALRNKDALRLKALLLTDSELDRLGLGKELADKTRAQIEQTRDLIDQVVARQSVVKSETEWVSFGGTWPGRLPATAHGGEKDLIAFENVLAIVSTKDEHGQLTVGTLVQVDNTWRLISAPAASQVTNDATAGAPLFFSIASNEAIPTSTGDTPLGISEEVQKLVDDLSKLDEKLTSAQDPSALGTLHAARSRVLAKLVDASTDEDRPIWIRQLLDTVSAAVQTGAYPDGLEVLEQLATQLETDKADSDLQAHARWVAMNSRYAQELSAEDAAFEEIQTDWQQRLEKFADDYPKSEDTPEVLLQLAMAKEFVGEDEEAVKWYKRIDRDFPDTPVATKAAGAQRRLELDNKPFSLRGQTLDGKAVDTSRLKGRLVLYHYWASWCEPCKQDIKEIATLYREHGKNFVPIGICLDLEASQGLAQVRSGRMNWPQLHEQQGLEGSLATDLGIFTLPVMILVDGNGNVVNRNIHVRELEAELKKRLARK